MEYEPFTNGPAMMEASDSWDVCTTGAAGVLVGMIGYDVICVGAADYEKNMGLFVRPESGLAKKRPRTGRARPGFTPPVPMHR